MILNENGLAYFYQFKDSYIYNFSYEGTLIEEIIDMQCVLELASTTEGKASETYFLADIDSDTSV